MAKIIANDIKFIDHIYNNIKSIKVDMSTVGEKELNDLKNKLSGYPGKVPVYLSLSTKAHKSVQILVGEDNRDQGADVQMAADRQDAAARVEEEGRQLRQKIVHEFDHELALKNFMTNVENSPEAAD